MHERKIPRGFFSITYKAMHYVSRNTNSSYLMREGLYDSNLVLHVAESLNRKTLNISIEGLLTELLTMQVKSFIRSPKAFLHQHSFPTSNTGFSPCTCFPPTVVLVTLLSLISSYSLRKEVMNETQKGISIPNFSHYC